MPNHSIKNFQQGFGVSIAEYTRDKKMNHAQALLQAGSMSAFEVALAVGYSDQCSFGRAYERFYGHTPQK